MEAILLLEGASTCPSTSETPSFFHVRNLVDGSRTQASSAHSTRTRASFNRSQLLTGGGDRTALLYSLDGLLVLSSQRPGLFVVCNPATRQCTSLPAPPPEPRRLAAVACGFYRHGEPGEYRLLCHVGYRRRSYYFILAAGAAAPRRFGRAPHPRSSAGYDVPVAHRGILYWLASHPEASTGKMLAFDTASETFRLMSGPPAPAGDTAASGLLELDDGRELGVAAAMATHSATMTSLEIWGLEDYGAETWTLRHRVEVPALLRMSLSAMPGGFYGSLELPNRFLPVGDGEIILIGNCSRFYGAI